MVPEISFSHLSLVTHRPSPSLKHRLTLEILLITLHANQIPRRYFQFRKSLAFRDISYNSLASSTCSLLCFLFYAARETFSNQIKNEMCRESKCFTTLFEAESASYAKNCFVSNATNSLKFNLQKLLGQHLSVINFC